jgi:ParB-like chromosome segregation protein Spo0J
MKIHSALSLQPIDRLIPYARNSRTHSPEQVAQIAASIREFGFTNPVLIDEQGGVIAGHGRIMAAQSLGLEQVPCLTLEGLSDTQKRAYVIADNKLAENAGWNQDLLAAEMQALIDDGYDPVHTGFDEREIDALLDVEPIFAPGTEEDQGKLDELAPKIVTCPHCNQEFDARGQV